MAGLKGQPGEGLFACGVLQPMLWVRLPFLQASVWIPKVCDRLGFQQTPITPYSQPTCLLYLLTSRSSPQHKL